MLIRSLARVGITALVDEGPGFRGSYRRALQAILIGTYGEFAAAASPTSSTRTSSGFEDGLEGMA